jgi:hypothetical protein
MEIIFTDFIFAYSLAEFHKNVATIIFYFARAVSHAAVRTDRLCFFLVSALQAGTQKVGGKKKNFGPDQKALLSERF